MGIYAASLSSCLRELTLCADVVFTMMDFQPFVCSERELFGFVGRMQVSATAMTLQSIVVCGS